MNNTKAHEGQKKALTAADFELKYDDEHTFPFIETEDCIIVGFGHHDRDGFAKLVTEYDKLAGFDEPTDAAHVQWLWAARDEEYFERYGEDRLIWAPSKVNASTPGAFKITVVSR